MWIDLMTTLDDKNDGIQLIKDRHEITYLLNTSMQPNPVLGQDFVVETEIAQELYNPEKD